MSFSKACEKVLDSDIDGLLLVPAISSIAREFIKKLSNDLPYVFFDSTVPQSKSLSSIVQDSRMSGQLAGRLMHLILDGAGPVALLRVLPEDFHIEERVSGFQDYFSSHPQYGLKIYDVTYQGDVNRFQAFIHQILDETSELKGFFISNALTFCAGRVLQERGLDKKVRVVGYDLLPENVRMLNEGIIDFLISQQSEQQGYQGIYTLFRRIVLNESVPEKIMMPIDIITKENVNYYQT